MPTKSTLLGTRSWIEGMLVGVEDLKIGKGGDAVFLTTAQTALIERGEKVKGQYDLISTELMKN